MDVRCERCNTEYELDDALVSGRGTTVRCTECGHQFKVRRAGAADADARVEADPADRWVVQTASGQTLTFLTFRDLRRAILAQRIARRDLLLPSGAPPRPLGSIADLEPLFEESASSRPSQPAQAPAVGIVAAPVVMAEPDAPPEMTRTAPWGLEAAIGRSQEEVPPRGPDTLRPPTGNFGGAPPPAAHRSFAAAPETVALHREPFASERQGPVLETSRAADMSPAGGNGSPRIAGAPQARGHEQAPLAMRARFDSSAEESYGLPRRRRVGGWVVALALLLAAAGAGWVVARPYLIAPKEGVAIALDPRAEAFLSAGERALSDGDLETAQEQFDKASALAERDPRVLRDQARTAAARADVPWLKLRLLPPDAVEEARTTKLQLDDRVARARAAADIAVTVTPDDPSALRARIDALRMLGDRDAARGYVTKIIAQTSQPETAYVLAALDLAEAAPLWTTVLDRLRIAASAEGNAGRARAALVYALMRSGKPVEAKAELTKLDSLTRPYPLAPALHAFVERPAPAMPLALAPPTASSSSPPNGNQLAAASREPAPHPFAQPAVVAGGLPAPADAAAAMQAASRAIHRGDWPRARQIYEAVVARNPNDSEALAGIGDVARAQGDLVGAIRSYKRTLAVNPSYLPALLGLADTEWASGDRANAARTYKTLVDHFPDGTYPSYAKARAEPGTAETSGTPAAAETGTSDRPGGPSPKPGTEEEGGGN